MIEDVQRNMGGKSLDEMRPSLLPFDKGAIPARRLLADLMSQKKSLLPTTLRGVAVP
jgi:hypothetical protein